MDDLNAHYIPVYENPPEGEPPCISCTDGMFTSDNDRPNFYRFTCLRNYEHSDVESRLKQNGRLTFEGLPSLCNKYTRYNPEERQAYQHVLKRKQA